MRCLVSAVTSSSFLFHTAMLIAPRSSIMGTTASKASANSPAVVDFCNWKDRDAFIWHAYLHVGCSSFLTVEVLRIKHWGISLTVVYWTIYKSLKGFTHYDTFLSWCLLYIWLSFALILHYRNATSIQLLPSYNYCSTNIPYGPSRKITNLLGGVILQPHGCPTPHILLTHLS